MKKIVYIITVFLFCSTILTAQTFQVERLYQKYRGEQGVIAIWIPGVAMKLACSIADLDGAEDEFLRSIKSLRVLTIEDQSLFPGVNFTREANITSGQNGYQTMIQVNDAGEEIMILGREKNGKLKDMIILVGGDENILVHIKGNLNADMMGSLAQIAGLDNVCL